MDATYHRHDISDKVWAVLEPHLPGQRGQWSGIAKDSQRFINAVFWVLRTGAPWRDLPPDYGKFGEVLPLAVPRPLMPLLPQYRFTVSLFGLLFVLNSCRHCLGNRSFFILHALIEPEQYHNTKSNSTVENLRRDHQQSSYTKDNTSDNF